MQQAAHEAHEALRDRAVIAELVRLGLDRLRGGRRAQDRPRGVGGDQDLEDEDDDGQAEEHGHHGQQASSDEGRHLRVPSLV